MAAHREMCRGTIELECCCPPHLCTAEYFVDCQNDQIWQQIQQFKGVVERDLGSVTWWDLIDLGRDGWIIVYQYECDKPNEDPNC